MGSRLRVVISYVDGQGNLEPLTSPPSTPVKNVNDKPTGSARLIGSSVEDSALVVDTSNIADEDGIGGFDISWQRSSSKSSWEAYPAAQSEVLRLTQNQVGFSFRAVVSYIDTHGTREVLYTSPSETIDNLDDPVQGEVSIDGEPKEGATLTALSNSLTDEDGIASISISWEKSKDGRNWIVLNSLSGPVLSLNQTLVGSQIRASVAVVDNFGIETNLYSQATRTVENINNAMNEAANGPLKGILATNSSPLVSKDFNHNPHSSIFDLTQTQVSKGKFSRVLSWYDNEWGFSNRMCDTAIQIAGLI